MQRVVVQTRSGFRTLPLPSGECRGEGEIPESKTPSPCPLPEGEGSENFSNAACTDPHASSPSRHSNPFATCWTHPGAIPFRFSNGISVKWIIEQFNECGGRGAIVGPHGSGKSTLLKALKPALREQGWHIHSMTVRDNGRCDGELPRGLRGWGNAPVEFSGALPQPPVGSKTMWIIDGYEQWSRFQRFKVVHRARRTGCALLVTAHAPTNVPTLLELLPTMSLIQSLVADLAARVSTAVTPEDVIASHACHGSNVRNIFFDLYDRHERARRALPAGNIR